MNKLEYFIYSIKNNLYLERAWLLSTFAILESTIENKFFIKESGTLKVKIKKEDKEEIIEILDYQPGSSLYNKDERCQLLNNSLPFIESDQESTYGILIINCLLFLYPYNGKVKYENRYLTPGSINDIAYNLLKGGFVTVDEHIKFENAVSMITCLSQIGVPSATRKAITPNPEAIKLKQRLLEENKDKLNDPAIVADIQQQLINLDKEYLSGDRSNGFFIKAKNWNVTRLKTMGMYGAEPDFYDESKISVMDAALADGWSKDNLPMLINNLRGGSFARGKETALGGESTKITSRIFQNYRIDIDDCNTTKGLKIKLNGINYKQYVGRYVVSDNESLTIEKLKSLKDSGKTILLRSPAGCITPGSSYCKKCFGHAVADGGLGLNSQSIIATSTFMSISMSAMHSRALTVHRFNYKERLT